MPENRLRFFLLLPAEPLILEQNATAMLRTLILTLLFTAAFGEAQAQQTAKPLASGKGIIYNRETAFNLKVSTNRGYAPGLEFGRLRTYYKTTFYHVSIGELKHGKEQRQSANPSIGRAFRPFIYGKQNNLLMLRGGWGVKRYYSEKARQKGVALGMSYSFGPSIGLLKPYYLALSRVADNASTGRVSLEKYGEDNADLFLDNTRILGAAPFTKGFGEISPVLGGNASVAFHMDWGAFDEVVKALEIGLMVDAFATKVPILIGEQNNRLFFNFFVNLQLGKRR